MKIGFIGLGKMGSNMALNLLDKGHEVIGYDRDVNKLKLIKHKKFLPTYSYLDFTSNLGKRKIVFIMVTAGKPVDEIISNVSSFMSKDDVIIDGGNSFYKDSQKRHKELSKKGLYFLDVGVSGGIYGARNGACLMIGGDKKAFNKTEKIFSDLSVKDGYSYVGKSGAGHFVKMIHNGIEYSIVAGISEGIDVIHKHENEFLYKTDEIVKLYNNGSIIESKLLSYLYNGLKGNLISKANGSIPKGETENEMKKLIKLSNISMLKEAIKIRENTRKKPSFIGKLIAVMRNQFGGHNLK